MRGCCSCGRHAAVEASKVSMKALRLLERLLMTILVAAFRDYLEAPTSRRLPYSYDEPQSVLRTALPPISLDVALKKTLMQTPLLPSTATRMFKALLHKTLPNVTEALIGRSLRATSSAVASRKNRQPERGVCPRRSWYAWPSMGNSRGHLEKWSEGAE